MTLGSPAVILSIGKRALDQVRTIRGCVSATRMSSVLVMPEEIAVTVAVSLPALDGAVFTAG